jgi:ribosome biogenesis GTPase
MGLKNRGITTMNLNELGWNITFNHEFERFNTPGCLPARIACVERQRYLAYSEAGELALEISGRMLHLAQSRSDFPAVGDWVAVKLSENGTGTIHAILPRKSSLSRKVAGATTEEQVIAANVDALLIVSGLDGDFNLRRIERFLALAWNSGISPVIVLNKADVCPEVAAKVAEVEAIAFGIPVLALSALEQPNLDALKPYFKTGKTVALVGSSGVGKSSIINRLLNEDRQPVYAVRADDSRGRHTTTRRELIFLPEGGMIIDNPGMRQIQLWADEESIQETFEDIEAIAAACRFSDCLHANEPGCAVQQALADGHIDRKRFQNYLKLQKEVAYLETRQNKRAQLNYKAKWKKIALQIREIKTNGK